MEDEMAQLETTDSLIGEQSSDDLAQLIEQGQQPEDDIYEPQESGETEFETVDGEEPESDVAEELEAESLAAASPSELEALRKDKETLMSLVQRLAVKEEKPKETAYTKEELIEQFAEDPNGYIQRQIEPYREMLARVEQQTIEDSARMSNSDFARLEPAVSKLRQAYPNLDKLDTRKRLEVYYLLAKGMESQERELRSKQTEASKNKQRLKSKQEAASIPAIKKSVPKEKPAKRPEDMTTADLEKAIRAISG